jgi:hypothetical protein
MVGANITPTFKSCSVPGGGVSIHQQLQVRLVGHDQAADRGPSLSTSVR